MSERYLSKEFREQSRSAQYGPPMAGRPVPPPARRKRKKDRTGLLVKIGVSGFGLLAVFLILLSIATSVLVAYGLWEGIQYLQRH